MKKFALLSALGAILGTLARYLIGVNLPHSDMQSLPWAILIVNILGAFAIGMFASMPSIMTSEERRFFLVTGVLGGFTTYSAIAVDVIQMPIGIATTYIAVTFIAGVTATHLGTLLVKK